MQKAIKISLIGLVVETVGLILDVGHHLNIGIETPEELISPWHLTIGIGFFITAIGILMVYRAHKNAQS